MRTGAEASGAPPGIAETLFRKVICCIRASFDLKFRGNIIIRCWGEEFLASRPRSRPRGDECPAVTAPIKTPEFSRARRRGESGAVGGFAHFAGPSLGGVTPRRPGARAEDRDFESAPARPLPPLAGLCLEWTTFAGERGQGVLGYGLRADEVGGRLDSGRAGFGSQHEVTGALRG